jgi:hypothetical protein
MAPAVLTTPRSPAHKEHLMDTSSVAYVLCRIEDDSSLTPVSRHGDSRRRLRGRGRGPRIRVRTLLRRSFEGVGHPRCVLPRGQDRLPSVGREDRAHQPERRGSLRPRRRRAYGVVLHNWSRERGRRLASCPAHHCCGWHPDTSLRESCGGWVSRNERAIIGSAHPLEKSAPDSTVSSIHRSRSR